MWYPVLCASLLCCSLINSWVLALPVARNITPKPSEVQVDEPAAHKDLPVGLDSNLAKDKTHQPGIDAPPGKDMGVAKGNPQVVPPPDDGEAVGDINNIKVNSELLKKMGKLDRKDLEPVDHLDVVKMEQDGHVNKEYHKEMFLGKEHDEFKSENVETAAAKLNEVVAKADTNKDGSLSSKEMEEWIKMKMEEHFREARDENDHIFKHLDPDGDGYVKWKEYYVHFLLSRGFDLDKSLQHVQDYDDSVILEQNDKDALVSYKFRWMDADSEPMDNILNKEEFMAFRHPEHSKRSLETMAGNVLSGIDTDNDKMITLEEFIMLPPGEVENEEYAEMDRKWQDERKKEFIEMIDLNHDGKADIREMKNYLDPTNPLQARLEAESLISLMDDNKDNLLSMEEIMKHSELFISSKVINFAANVHDEF